MSSRQHQNIILNLLLEYNKIKNVIETRLKEFEEKWRRGDEEEIFYELIFCLLTPQSKARTCWDTVLEMREEGVILKNSKELIREHLKRVRFRNNKAEYIMKAKELFFKGNRFIIKEILSKFDTPFEMREYLVKNVKGMGYKEASHFLRNIGLGEDIAILDRHILKNLKTLNVIEDIPSAMSRKKYLNIEEKMRSFSERIDIPMEHLDLLLWYRETGEVFK